MFTSNLILSLTLIHIRWMDFNKPVKEIIIRQIGISKSLIALFYNDVTSCLHGGHAESLRTMKIST
jgi:hypothetical protein